MFIASLGCFVFLSLSNFLLLLVLLLVVVVVVVVVPPVPCDLSPTIMLGDLG